MIAIVNRSLASVILRPVAASSLLLLLALLLLTLFGAPAAVAAGAAAAPLVVIDPGHGGTNVGAYGPTIDTYEKRLTLAIARQAAERLRRHGRVRAVLTRTTDRYLTLQQRVARANALDAAAFVSIHLNASPTRAQQGFETYVLSRGAADAEAKRVAMRENEIVRSQRGQPHVAGQRSDVADVAAILADLGQRAQMEASAGLALAIHAELRATRGKAVDRGLRQAPFDVLMGLRAPGVLVELGFIDHPIEGRDLARHETQRELARAVAAGIERFVAGRRSLAPDR